MPLSETFIIQGSDETIINYNLLRIAVSIPYLLSFSVSCNRIGALFSPNISAVPTKCVLISMHQLIYYCHIVFIRSGGYDMMNQTSFTVYADMRFVSEVPCVALFR